MYLDNGTHVRLAPISGVARGGHLPPPGGGRQNHAKEFFKIYILRNFEKSERIQ